MRFPAFDSVLTNVRKTARLMLAAAMACSASLGLAQAPGSPDPAWTVTKLPGKALASMAIQADGKVLVVGYDDMPGALMLRFNGSGGLDSTFGAGGAVRMRNGFNGSSDAGIAVSPDGGIHAAGLMFTDDVVGDARYRIEVTRYRSDGTEDESYGVALGALANFDEGSVKPRFRKIAFQPDGKMLLMADGHEAGADEFTRSMVVARFGRDGHIDPSFGSMGRTVVRLAGVDEGTRAMQVAADGSIVLMAPEGDGIGGFVVKLTPSGNPDTAFGAGGTVNLQASGSEVSPTSIAVQHDGKIVVGARQSHSAFFGGELVIFRLNTNGTLDTQFGNAGYSAHELSIDADIARTMAVEPSGRILVAGIKNARRAVQGEAFLLRLLPSGQADTRFGTGGLVTPPGYSAADMGLDAAGAAYLLIANITSLATTEPDKFAIRKFATLTPTAAPTVSINGGNRTIPDVDNVAGETVSVAATATDSDGTIASTQWLVNGVATASGTSATLALSEGANLVSFKATDNDGATATAAVTYTVQAPTTTLPRIRGYSSGQMASDSEFSIAIRNSSGALVSSAPQVEKLGLTGYLFPQAADEDALADIFVVAATSRGWFMRNPGGAFVPWNGAITSLVPAYEGQQLSEQVRVDIFTGPFPFAGTFRVYIGYMRVDRYELIYTDEAATVEIRGN